MGLDQNERILSAGYHKDQFWIPQGLEPQGLENYKEDLGRIAVWVETWQMGLNVDKCKLMVLD